jgi:hypothetical protein
MIRPASWLVAVAAAAWLALAAQPSDARADDMDLALSRLRLGDLCTELEPSLPAWATRCKDQEMFERLVSEYAVAMAPPSAGPARSLGARGFQLSLDMTVTEIEAGSKYWVRGTEGAQRLQTGASFGQNPAPAPVLIWNRLQVRKGLPFGFEAGAALGQGIDTSMWTLGLMLKWALFEGFRTHLGRLPDVSIQGGYSRSVGSSQATMQLATFDLSLSKPFVVEHTWTITPLLGMQTLFVNVRSGVVDLTPGGQPGDMTPPAEDAFAACAPRAPSGTSAKDPPDVAPNGQPCAEAGGGADFAYAVVFDPVTQTRVRAFGGAQLRYDMFLLQLIMHYDLAAPGLKSKGRNWGDDEVPRQLAFNVAFGAVL